MTSLRRAEKPQVIPLVEETGSSFAISVFDSLNCPKVAKLAFYRAAATVDQHN